MRPDYDGVEYFDKGDIALNYQLEKAAKVISEFREDIEVEDINIVIELYNIKKIYSLGVIPSSWSKETYDRQKVKADSAIKVIGKFLAKINDDNFIEYESSVAIQYIEDFLYLLTKYKVIERISHKIFEQYILREEAPVNAILKIKGLVDYYDLEIANMLRVSEHTPQILAYKFLEKNSEIYYLPKQFKPEEYEAIFQKYVDSFDPHPNILHLIANCQSTAECPISNRLRMNARHAYDKFWSENEGVVRIESSVNVGFRIQDEIETHIKQGNEFQVFYDIRWFEENLDYPTIFNNFMYVFSQFDLMWRSRLVSVKSDISGREKLFAINGVRYYAKGTGFETIARLSNLQTSLYYDFLSTKGINIEKGFKWFFEEYLPMEFKVQGFSMTVSSEATTYLEKCRNLVAEMDGVLKQFRMYATEGEINRELFEMSSEHLIIDTLPSLLKEKYAYPQSEDIHNMMHCLFSDQALMAFTKKTLSKYSTLFMLLCNENVLFSDFEQYQRTTINWLADNGCLTISENEEIMLNMPKVLILKDIYDNDVICLNRIKMWTSEINKMIDSGDLRVEATLFSEVEKDYLNYELNKAEYSNGLDLRNKYAHSTYPKGEAEQRKDYIELIKLMILVITKMNDEFCEREKNAELN